MRKSLAVLINLILGVATFAQQTQGPINVVNPGTFISTQPNQPNVFNMNALDIQAEIQYGQAPTTHFTEALTAGVKVPVGANLQVNTIGAYILNYSTAPAVGGYFDCHQKAATFSSGGCWGLNPIVTSDPGITAKLTGIEVDVNAHNSGDNAIGVNINGSWSVASVPVSQAIYVNPPGMGKWSYGVTFADNCCVQHYIGRVTTTGVSTSQPLIFGAQNAGGTLYQTAMQEGSDGGFNIYPATNGSHFFNIGNSASIALQAGQGYYGAQPNQGLVDDSAGGGWNFSVGASSAYGIRFWNGTPGVQLIAQIDASGTYKNGNGTILPATLTGDHGNSTKVQLSDNTGTSGNLVKFDANGNATDGGISAAAVPTKSGTPTVGAGVCWKTASQLGTCTAGTWPNCTTCN